MMEEAPRYKTFCSYTVGGGSVSSHPPPPPQPTQPPHPQPKMVSPPAHRPQTHAPTQHQVAPKQVPSGSGYPQMVAPPTHPQMVGPPTHPQMVSPSKYPQMAPLRTQQHPHPQLVAPPKHAHPPTLPQMVLPQMAGPPTRPQPAGTPTHPQMGHPPTHGQVGGGGPQRQQHPQTGTPIYSTFPEAIVLPPLPRPHPPSHGKQDQGEYRVGIKFNDKHIPDSPYKVYISPDMGEARKVEIAQFPEQGGKPNKAQNLLVLKNGAKGTLDCKLVAPSGHEDDCFTDPLDSDTYSVRFVPREIGIHYIHVKFNGIHIPGSPFRLRIGKDEADPAAVSASGKGLEACVSGHKSDFIVDTCNAGAGTLAVTIDGPSKVSMDCTEVEEGYKVRYTPLVPGDYYIAIKFNGYHIVGSPFKVKCSGEAVAEKGVQESSSVVVETVEKQKSDKHGHGGPIIPRFTSDASKVTSKGLGLKKAHLNRQNNFTVNASAAGNNILYVGVYGPKAPCEEVYIKHIGHNNYQVGYKIHDRGDYILLVKWGDEHIPGSPFSINV